MKRLPGLSARFFDLAFHGMGMSRIAQTLTREKIPCPGWFQYTRNGGCARFFEGQPEEKKYMWSLPYLKVLLKDETYIGNTIHNRWGTVSYKNKRMVRTRMRSACGLREPMKRLSRRMFLNRCKSRLPAAAENVRIRGFISLQDS